MDILTLYAAQGDLVAIRAGNEAIIVDAHMPDCDDVTPVQIEQSLQTYLVAKRVRGLILTGLDPSGFTYLVTGDTETGRWERIDAIFGGALRSDVLSAPHHGSRSGVHVPSLVHISPNTVLISAGVDSCYGHPDAAAVKVYQSVAKHVFATNVEDGICLLTRRVGNDYDTQLVRHVAAA